MSPMADKTKSFFIPPLMACQKNSYMARDSSKYIITLYEEKKDHLKTNLCYQWKEDCYSSNQSSPQAVSH